jgi:hypothetical protein
MTIRHVDNDDTREALSVDVAVKIGPEIGRMGIDRAISAGAPSLSGRDTEIVREERDANL